MLLEIASVAVFRDSGGKDDVTWTSSMHGEFSVVALIQGEYRAPPFIGEPYGR